MSKLNSTLSALVFFFLCPILVAHGNTKNGIPLESTNVITFTPKGWVHATFVYSSIPSVNFAIPLSREGTYSGDVDLSVSLISTHLKIHSLSAYIEDLRQDNISKKAINPFHFKIGQRPAILIVTRGDKIVDFTDGTGTNVTMVYETVTLQDGDALYQCDLVTKPDKYPIYRGAAVRLCMGLLFSPSPATTRK